MFRIQRPPGLERSQVTKFDPIGGIQNHTAQLTRMLRRHDVRPAHLDQLDRFGFAQAVLSTRPRGYQTTTSAATTARIPSRTIRTATSNALCLAP